MIKPPILSSHSYYGLAGDIIGIISPHTEASSAALLSQLFCAFGNSIGREAYFRTEADKQRANIFVLNNHHV